MQSVWITDEGQLPLPSALALKLESTRKTRSGQPDERTKAYRECRAWVASWLKENRHRFLEARAELKRAMSDERS